MQPQDKLIERNRYDALSKAKREHLNPLEEPIIGSASLPYYLRAPYLFYEQKINEHASAGCRVLELAAGGGLHTMTLIGTGAEVTVTDISAESLSLLRERFRRVKGNLKAQLADIEALPFSGSTFDVVTCAGSLSYGDNTIVMGEVFRVLKPGGIFICVDSLNNNPVYRFNRWLHYLRGNRTKSTLLRMPTMQLIHSYRRRFGYVEAHFFGSLMWCIPLFVLLFGQFKSSIILDRLDRIIDVRASAFKFVMVARKY